MDRTDDSDSDFSDIGEDVENDEINLDSAPRLNKNGIKVRGADKSWVEIHRFDTAKDFKESDIAQRLDKEFSKRKTREYDYADVLEYDCKFSRRVGFLACPWKIKVKIDKKLNKEGLINSDTIMHCLFMLIINNQILFSFVCTWYRNNCLTFLCVLRLILIALYACNDV